MKLLQILGLARPTPPTKGKQHEMIFDINDDAFERVMHANRDSGAVGFTTTEPTGKRYRRILL